MLSRIRDGVKNVSPLQSLVAKRWGVLGQLFGMLLAMGMLIYQRSYIWLPFLGFTLFLLFLEFLSVHQSVVRLRELDEKGE